MLKLRCAVILRLYTFRDFIWRIYFGNFLEITRNCFRSVDFCRAAFWFLKLLAQEILKWYCVHSWRSHNISFCATACCVLSINSLRINFQKYLLYVVLAVWEKNLSKNFYPEVKIHVKLSNTRNILCSKFTKGITINTESLFQHNGPVRWLQAV